MLGLHLEAVTSATAKSRLTLISWLVTFAEEGLWGRMLNFSAGWLHCLELGKKEKRSLFELLVG